MVPDLIVKSHLPGYNIPEISVGEYYREAIEKVIENEPNKIAFIDPESGSQLSFKQLNETAKKFGTSIISRLPSDDVEKGRKHLCLCYGENCFEYVTLVTSMSYLGIGMCPTSPGNGMYEVVQSLTDSKSTIMCVTLSRMNIVEKILANPEYSKLITNLKMLVIMDSHQSSTELKQKWSLPDNVVTYNDLVSDGNFQNPISQFPYYPIDPSKDHYLIVYTSGSTGQPKGAIHTHRSFIAAAMAIQKANIFSYLPNTCINFSYPFGHISGSILLALCFTMPMTSVVFKNPSKELIFKSVEQYRISLLFMFIALGFDMAENDYRSHYDLSSLKVMWFSGTKVPEHVSKTLSSRYGVIVHELYGSTEMMGGVSAIDAKAYNPGNVGAPLPNVEMKIIDLVSGKSLAEHCEGEICLRGPNRFIGYLNNVKATNETIDSERWYHTGDVGYYDRNGSLFITDRIKEMIKYKIWSISPAEVEAFIQTHPMISCCCVVGVPHQTEGMHLRAFVQLKNDGSKQNLVTENDLINYVKENMGYNKRINGGVRFIDSIPRTLIGKIDRPYFKKMVKDELLTDKAELE